MRSPRSSIKALVFALSLVLGTVAQAQVLDLRTAIVKALEHEATYRAARAERDASAQEIPRARAGLLPQLSITAGRTENRADIEQTNALGQRVSREDEYVSENFALTLRQPLFRRDAWVRYDQAGTRVEIAEQQLESERARLVSRVGEAYLNCLLADAGLQLVESEITALEGIVQAARRGLEAGVATRTDLLDAEARLDTAKVRLIEGLHGRSQAQRTLESLVGGQVAALWSIDGERLVLDGLQGGLDYWLDRAREMNPEILAARLGVELARKEVQLQQAAHYPTVDLIAQRQKSGSDSVTSIGTTSYTNLWGVQLSIPLFSGGQVTASTRQAASRLERAQAEHDASLERVMLHVAKAFETLRAAAQRVRALERAEASADASLEGSEKGLAAGTRSLVDVLNARQQVFEVRRSRAQANAEFIFSLLDLSAVGGDLSDTAFERVNSMLSARKQVELTKD